MVTVSADNRTVTVTMFTSRHEDNRARDQLYPPTMPLLSVRPFRFTIGNPGAGALRSSSVAAPAAGAPVAAPPGGTVTPTAPAASTPRPSAATAAGGTVDQREKGGSNDSRGGGSADSGAGSSKFNCSRIMGKVIGSGGDSGVYRVIRKLQL